MGTKDRGKDSNLSRVVQEVLGVRDLFVEHDLQKTGASSRSDGSSSRT